VIRGALPGIVWLLLATSGNGFAQSAAAPNPIGKNAFEQSCAMCHGLDGRGGEHAPDIIGRTEVKDLSDQALFKVIREGIPQRGMPAFGGMDKADVDAIIVYLRLLQGTTSGGGVSGNPEKGRDLFFGKAECTHCHVIRGDGQFLASDLSDFARDHEPGEIRDAILKPSVKQPEIATAIARDGRKFSGVVRNEDNMSLQLQDGDGRFYLLVKSNLASVERQSGPAMPGDYGQRLSVTEIDNLVAYLVAESPRPESSRKDATPHGED